MTTQSSVIEYRISQFNRAFPRISHREHWLTLYLNLREGGDTHSAAVETIRAEKKVASLIR